VKFYRRKDGSILTDNCPVGLRALRRRAQRIRKAIASSVIGFLAGIGAYGAVDAVASYLLLRPATSYGHTMGQMVVREPAIPGPPPVVGKFLYRPPKPHRK
jgi:hypothetical protein